MEIFTTVEVKHTDRVCDADLRSLAAFGADYPQAELRLLYRGAERLEIRGIRCLPVEEFLLGLVPHQSLP